MVISETTMFLMATIVLVLVKSNSGLLIVGIVAIAAGVVSIIFRRRIRDWIVRAQKRSFGQTVGNLMEGTRPWAIAGAGVFFILLGVFCLIVMVL